MAADLGKLMEVDASVRSLDLKTVRLATHRGLRLAERYYSPDTIENLTGTEDSNAAVDPRLLVLHNAGKSAAIPAP